jgi:hypothetical protein
MFGGDTTALPVWNPTSIPCVRQFGDPRSGDAPAALDETPDLGESSRGVGMVGAARLFDHAAEVEVQALRRFAARRRILQPAARLLFLLQRLECALGLARHGGGPMPGNRRDTRSDVNSVGMH